MLAETPEQLMLEADTNVAAAPDDPFARLNNRLAPQGGGAAAAGLKVGACCCAAWPVGWCITAHAIRGWYTVL